MLPLLFVACLPRDVNEWVFLFFDFVSAVKLSLLWVSLMSTLYSPLQKLNRMYAAAQSNRKAGKFMPSYIGFFLVWIDFKS